MALKEHELPQGADRYTKKGIEKFVNALHRNKPAIGRAVLKTMAKKVKEKECNICLHSDITIIPTTVWLCSECVRKYANRFGEIKILTRQNCIPSRRCTGCMKERVTHFQVNVWLCHKCLPKIAKREKEIHNDYRDRIRKLIGRDI